MDIVDTQVHIGPGGAAEMVAAMDALGIASVLLDEWWPGTPDHPGYHVAEGKVYRKASPAAELASWTYPGRFSYLLRVDRHDPELQAMLRLARDSTYARALRLAPGLTRAELAAFAAGEYDALFATATDCGLPMVVQTLGQTPLLARYLDKFPQAKIIIDHTGIIRGRMCDAFASLEGLPDSVEYWRKVGAVSAAEQFDVVLRMAEWPNVALKWAHAPNMFDAAGYPNEGTRPYLRKAIDAFGADRVMWASDAISANFTGETWAELLFAIRTNPDLSQTEQEYVLGRTARTWLNWDVVKAL